MTAVAGAADISAGSVYQHFASKSALAVEVFRRAAGREVDVLDSVLSRPGTPVERLAQGVEVFARRALENRGLAYALLAAPADTAVGAERLVFRRRYRTLFAEVIREGMAHGALPPQNGEITAAALTGAIGEVLVAPLGAPEEDDTVAWLVGDEGRGVRTIIDTVTMTRLDCVLGSAAGTLAALAQATHHVRHRAVCGAKLIDQPLMRNVIADLALESEAATTLALRLAGATDRAQHGDTQERAFLRIATAVGKYWVCKRQPAAVAEALECLGGNGYVEESGMPRLYREAPLNGIWEGSGNVNALDMLRALSREPESFHALRTEIEAASGADRRLDSAWRELQGELVPTEDAPLRARRVIERAALVLQGFLLVRHAPAAVADAFCASRLAGDRGLAFGTLPPGTDFSALLARTPV